MKWANELEIWSRIRSFARDRHGAAAVEFAIVAAPFFLLMLWLVQLGLYFMTQSAVDNGLLREAEAIRAGLVTGTLPNAANIKSGVVTYAGGLVSNNSTLQVELRTLSELSAASVAITDGVANYGTTTSTLVLRASGQVIAIAPGFSAINTVRSSALVRRQGL